MDALILAGGENKRISVIKGFLKLNGKTILESNIGLLGGLFDRVIVSTNNPELYFSSGALLVGDVIVCRGPMTGIFSTLIGPEVSEVFVTACDMPFINGILVEYMIDRWDSRLDAMVPVFESKPQPLCGIYSKKLAEKMEYSIMTGSRGLREFLKKVNVLYIGENEVRSIDREGKSFVNINTLEDFQREGGKTCLV
jgi:molybdopterin-guanine dinucleotide biosynthesis protein A